MVIIDSFMRSQQGFQMVLQVLVFAMVFLVGVFYPVDTLPVWMEILSKATPSPTALMPSARSSSARIQSRRVWGSPCSTARWGLGAEVAMVSALGLVLIAGAVLAFSRQE